MGKPDRESGNADHTERLLLLRRTGNLPVLGNDGGAARASKRVLPLATMWRLGR